MTFLQALRARLATLDGPTLVLGDFNQRVPRQRQPVRVAQALDGALYNFDLATSGFRSCEGCLTIDHIAHTRDLKGRNLTEVPRFDGGLKISDHFGVAAEISAA